MVAFNHMFWRDGNRHYASSLQTEHVSASPPPCIVDQALYKGLLNGDSPDVVFKMEVLGA